MQYILDRVSTTKGDKVDHSIDLPAWVACRIIKGGALSQLEARAGDVGSSHIWVDDYGRLTVTANDQ